MERQYYQKTKQLEQLSQPAASIPSAYEKEFNLKDKEKVLKDFYTNIRLFYQLVYGAVREGHK